MRHIAAPPAAAALIMRSCSCLTGCCCCALLLAAPDSAVAPDDGRMPYPLMGFDAWAADPGRPNETAIISIANALIRTGLREAGYVYMNWLIGYSRNATTGSVQLAEPERWTGGSLKYVVGWLHSHGFKFSTGLSPDRTSCTHEVGICGPRSASERYPATEHCHAVDDAKWFAEQGVDHWPSDECSTLCWNNSTCCVELYGRIWQAIQATGRNMSFGLYSGSGPCVARGYTWAPAISHYWRVGSDMKNVWSRAPGSVLGEVDRLIWDDAARQVQGPGRYNFLDALVVGAPNRSNTGTAGSGLSIDEARSHMGLWVALASPLILSVDVRNPIHPNVLAILTNPDVLAVHKDPLARQGKPIPAVFAGRPAEKLSEGLCEGYVSAREAAAQHPANTSHHRMYVCAPTVNDPVIVIAKPLLNGDTGLLFVNRGELTQSEIVVAFDDMHTELVSNKAAALRRSQQVVRDLWDKSVPATLANCCIRLPPLAPHASRFLRLSPARGKMDTQGACDQYRGQFQKCARINIG